MVFVRAYTAKQLNRGEGLSFHPMTGEALNSLVFQTYGQQFALYVSGLPAAWGDECDVVLRRPCIGDCGRKAYKAGDSFPRRWRFDPFSGTPIAVVRESVR
jgi:hypothetical protein